MMLDLDGFKEVNDTFGHNTGDLVLVQVAQRIVTSVRDDDAVARLGGDEFAVLLSHAPGDQVAVLARRVLAALELPLTVPWNHRRGRCQHRHRHRCAGRNRR